MASIKFTLWPSPGGNRNRGVPPRRDGPQFDVIFSRFWEKNLWYQTSRRQFTKRLCWFHLYCIFHFIYTHVEAFQARSKNFPSGITMRLAQFNWHRNCMFDGRGRHNLHKFMTLWDEAYISCSHECLKMRTMEAQNLITASGRLLNSHINFSLEGTFPGFNGYFSFRLNFPISHLFFETPYKGLHPYHKNSSVISSSCETH